MKSIADNVMQAASAFRIPEPEVGWEEHDRQVADKLANERALQVKSEQARKLVVMGVPFPLHETILGGPAETKAIDAARTMLIEKSTLALFSGKTGCGKTLAAAMWLLHAPVLHGHRHRDQRPRKFTTAADYCSMSPFSGSDSEDVAKAAYLVIDDVGQEYEDKRKYSNQRIDEIVSRRHADCLPTIITTNLSIDELRERYGDRVASRLNDALVPSLRNQADLREANR